MVDKMNFQKKHQLHEGFNYDSILCLGYYCSKCNEFFIISGESKTQIKKVVPKMINKELVPL